MNASRRILPLALAASLSAALAGTATAQNVVYWTDSNAGTSVLPGLQSIRPGMTFTAASSQAEFNTLLASGSYQLAIIGEQGNSAFAGSSAALGSFMAGGGRIIGSSWLSSSMPGFFEAMMVSQNQTAISGSGALFAGLVSPIQLSNPGWGVFSQGYAASGGASCLATFGNGSCAAVLGNGGQTLLLGPLFDTYTDPAVGGQFVANGVDLLLGSANPTVTPEPGTVVLMATGLLAVGGVVSRRRRRLES